MRERIFVDTSAIYAALDQDDRSHIPASEGWATLLLGIERGELDACTHSGVVIEATALVQRRLGIDAVRDLHGRLLAVVDIEWLDAPLTERAVASLLAAGRRDVSLVDWASFELMRHEGIDRALAFDEDFVEQGFALL